MSENERSRERAVVSLRASDDPWRDNELVRQQRISENARRPMAENLRATMELSEFLCSIAGTASRR